MWNETSQPPVRDVVRDHQGLLGFLDALEAADTGPALADGLARLEVLLAGHFAAEEGPGGLLSEARLLGPHRAAEIDALLTEHRWFEAALAELDGVPERVEQVRALCEALRAHERREAELLAELAYAEIGAGD